MCREFLRIGAGTPARPEPTRTSDRQGERLPAGLVRHRAAGLKIARSGLPEIVAVNEFRDTIGIGLTNIIGGAESPAS